MLRNILLGGLAVGTLDGTAAITHAAFRGISPWRVFQYVASGLLGPASFQGGTATVLLGVACHYFIATAVVALYFAASAKMPLLIRRAAPCGMAYGIAVFFFMSNVVVPLSATRKGAFILAHWLIGLGIHIFVVGLSTGLVVRFFSSPEPART